MVVRFKVSLEDSKPVRKAVRVIIKREDEIVLCKRLCLNTGTLICYDFPGGGIESHETPDDAVIKECLEEVGILVDNVRSLDVVSNYSFDPAGGDWFHLYSGGEDSYYVADFVRIDPKVYNVEGDALHHSYVRLDLAIQMIEDGPESASNEARLKALENLKELDYSFKSIYRKI